MPTTSYLDSDVVSVFDSPGPKNRTRLGTMLWGDQVRVRRRTRDHVVIEFTRRVWDDAARKYNWQRLDGYISSKVRLRDRAILKVRFIDVGQGDAAMVETPTGQLVLVDGGEARHLSNYVCSAWAYALRTRPLSIAAIVVTHGDADHYAGLPILVAARRSRESPAITVDRVFHNGLVKAPGADNVRTAFGRSTKVDQTTYLTDLEDDLLAVPDKRMNKPSWNGRRPWPSSGAGTGGSRSSAWGTATTRRSTSSRPTASRSRSSVPSWSRHADGPRCAVSAPPAPAACRRATPSTATPSCCG
jgi:hypothetical protein